MPMPQIFPPYADSVARVALVTRTQARRVRQLALGPAVVRLELYLLWVVFLFVLTFADYLSRRAY
jgi:hypothetical protein